MALIRSRSLRLAEPFEYLGFVATAHPLYEKSPAGRTYGASLQINGWYQYTRFAATLRDTGCYH